MAADVPGFADGERRVDTLSDNAGAPFNQDSLRLIDGWLAQRGALAILKPHPMEAYVDLGAMNAIQVLRQTDLERRGITLYEFLAASDGLITDISSIWIDYLLMDKPMVFAFPDIDEYRSARGINLEPYEEWIPGPLVRTAEGLRVHLEEIALGHDVFAEQRREALQRFHRYRDDRSTERLLTHVGL